MNNNTTIQDSAKESKKTIRNSAIIVIIIALLSYTVYETRKDSNIESRVTSIVKDAQNKLPVKIDDYTTMKAIVSNGLNIKYIYTVSGVSPEKVLSLKDALVEGHKVKLIGNSTTGDLFKAGVTFTYEYQMETGEKIMEFNIGK